tara:strand:+ start:834 stop:1064 length:231 start_codon:yes stop_codon:yes gene_type:complete
MNLNKLEAEQLMHLAEKIIDYAYINEHEDYMNKNEQKSLEFSDFVIDEEELYKSNHIFRYFYSLDMLINRIKSNNL